MNNEIKIQVLGSGCATCKKLYELTKEVVSEMNLDTEVEYITDIQKIVEMGVMSSPVLAIEGKPILVGAVSSLAKIKETIIANVPVEPIPNSACCVDKNACDINCHSNEKKDTNCSCGGSC